MPLRAPDFCIKPTRQVTSIYILFPQSAVNLLSKQYNKRCLLQRSFTLKETLQSCSWRSYKVSAKTQRSRYSEEGNKHSEKNRSGGKSERIWPSFVSVDRQLVAFRWPVPSQAAVLSLRLTLNHILQPSTTIITSLCTFFLRLHQCGNKDSPIESPFMTFDWFLDPCLPLPIVLHFQQVLFSSYLTEIQTTTDFYGLFWTRYNIVPFLFVS